jgi:hypothetical protein
MKQGPKSLKSVLGSTPGEDVFSNLGTKHDKRMAPTTQMLFSAGMLQKKGHNTENCPGFEFRWGWFCSSWTKHDRKTATRQNLFVTARGLRELRSKIRNLRWFWISMKMLSLGIIIIIIVVVIIIIIIIIIINVIFNDMCRMIWPIIISRAVKIGKECRHLLNFLTRTVLKSSKNCAKAKRN